MQLRYKTLAIIVAMIILTVVLMFGISQLILVKSYDALEEQDVASEVSRALKVIEFEEMDLGSRAVQFAYSDETYAYMAVPETAYISSNAADDVFANHRLNCLIMLDRSCKPLFVKGYNLSSKRQAPLPEGLMEHLTRDGVLDCENKSTGTFGLLMTRSGPLLVSAYPIKTTYGLGSPRGTLVVGRYLNGDEIEMLKDISSIDMSVRPYAGPGDGGSADERALASGDVLVAPVDDNRIRGSGILKDIYGNAALVLTVEMPRPIHLQEQNSLMFLALAVLIAGLLLAIVTLFLLENMIISRIASLDRSVSKIGKDNDLSGRVPVSGHDELSRFAATINRTMDALESSRSDLRASEQRFRGLVENINDIVWETGDGSRLTYVSPRIRELTGFGPEELTGRSFAGLAVPEDAERIAGAIDVSRPGPGSFSQIEARLKDREGAIVDVEISGAPIVDGQGKVTGYRGVVRDFRERKQVEKALHKWADIFQHAKIAIVICGPDAARFEMANPALAQIYGYAVEDMIGMKAKDVVAPECCNSFATGIRKARKEGHHTFESVHVRRDRSKFPVIVDITVARDAAGDVLHQIINIQDVTDRKRTEKQIMDSLREKDVLLKEIHHRVKNNLQIISSLLSLQSEKITPDNADIRFQESQHRIKSMALIHEKLYQSKDLSRIDFAEYVRSLTAYLARSYSTSPGIEIAIDIWDVSLGIDMAIPCGLIINELASNSLKYAFRDGRRGKISVAMARDGAVYVLTIADDGAGLPPGLNFRDTTTLGLQLVNTLTDQLEGVIEQLPGPGTAFRITFGGPRRPESQGP